MKFKCYEKSMMIGCMVSVMDLKVNSHQILSRNFLMIYKKYIVILKYKTQHIYQNILFIKLFYFYFVYLVMLFSLKLYIVIITKHKHNQKKKNMGLI